MRNVLRSVSSTAVLLVALGGGMASAPARADLVLGQADAICTSSANGGNDTDFLSGCGITGQTLYYKGDRGTVTSESGSFAPNYTTVFDPTTTAKITWDGGDFISCPDCYLIAKDGDSDPNWFLFDIGGWDGKTAIYMSDLFYKVNPAGQSIAQSFSHVSIWGKEDDGTDPPVTIPEPGSLALAGLALLGVGALRRRKA